MYALFKVSVVPTGSTVVFYFGVNVHIFKGKWGKTPSVKCEIMDLLLC